MSRTLVKSRSAAVRQAADPEAPAGAGARTRTRTRTDTDRRAGNRGGAAPPCGAKKTQSCGAYTVIRPDEKKRNKLQKIATSELSALEEFRQRQRVGHVSVAPRTVGGTLTMEEVRKKQQEEMVRPKVETKS
ncbi:epithelial-stromal interaction protein 1 [Latimeria chalumnae]|uniref:epithelial-stromal interaction protein 1 n=1 Tax=Latimeria chalumnae TaxID=7897 RepID=UPI0003C13EDF|nr:PREDICTED: epithelial-stromal interaction protein 1-like [Latimeria chalumnae]|eukprot:XP_005992802.1 PREDICTED: epithelial-stromal interaction protein 1-like [Latimeria chalumnae]